MKQQFSKPHHFLNTEGRDPLSILPKIFQTFTLTDFKHEINHWQHLALSNDQCTYDIGCQRENLLHFVKELQRLIEALYILSIRADRSRPSGAYGKKSRIAGTCGNPALLTEDEKDKPTAVITHFCNSFPQSYAKMELLDMLDAVITYEGNKKVYKGNLVLFYQHLHCLVKLAYRMAKIKSR